MLFRTKMILTTSCFMLLGLASFGIFSYHGTKQNSLKQVESSLTTTVKSLSDYIDLLIATKKNTLEQASYFFQDIDLRSYHGMVEKLQETTKTIDAIDSYVGFADGDIIYGSEKPRIQGFDPRKEPWYIQTKEAKKTLISSPF